MNFAFRAHQKLRSALQFNLKGIVVVYRRRTYLRQRLFRYIQICTLTISIPSAIRRFSGCARTCYLLIYTYWWSRWWPSTDLPVDAYPIVIFGRESDGSYSVTSLIRSLCQKPNTKSNQMLCFCWNENIFYYVLNFYNLFWVGYNSFVFLYIWWHWFMFIWTCHMFLSVKNTPVELFNA